jgi:hypothetical protein
LHWKNISKKNISYLTRPSPEARPSSPRLARAGPAAWPSGVHPPSARGRGGHDRRSRCLERARLAAARPHKRDPRAPARVCPKPPPAPCPGSAPLDRRLHRAGELAPPELTASTGRPRSSPPKASPPSCSSRAPLSILHHTRISWSPERR